MIAVKIKSVNFDPTNQMSVVILEDLEKGKVVPIWIGVFEAQAILFKLNDMHFPRPLTYDLMKNLIEHLKGRIDYILISNVAENTFYAEIHLSINGEKIVIDSRPSDALALALRASTPVFVSEEVYNEHSWDKEKFDEFQKTSTYRQRLDQTTDEEIGRA